MARTMYGMTWELLIFFHITEILCIRNLIGRDRQFSFHISIPFHKFGIVCSYRYARISTNFLNCLQYATFLRSYDVKQWILNCLIYKRDLPPPPLFRKFDFLQKNKPKFFTSFKAFVVPRKRATILVIFALPLLFHLHFRANSLAFLLINNFFWQ